MSDNQDYSDKGYLISQAAELTGIAVTTLRSWIGQKLVPAHPSPKVLRISKLTVEELAKLLQEHPIGDVRVILVGQKLNAVPAFKAAQDIGVSFSMLSIWIQEGHLPEVIIEHGKRYLPYDVVARLKKINYELSLAEAGRILRVDTGRITRMADKQWLRSYALPNGVPRYSRSDVTFWEHLLIDPIQRETTLSVLKTHNDVIRELTFPAGNNPSRRAQQLVDHTPAKMLEDIFSFRRRLLTSIEAEGTN